MQANPQENTGDTELHRAIPQARMQCIAEERFVGMSASRSSPISACPVACKAILGLPFAQGARRMQDAQGWGRWDGSRGDTVHGEWGATSLRGPP